MVAIGGIVVGTVLVGLGLLGVRHAYGITRFHEQLDAIGSTRSAGTVEPAEWNVTLTKLLSGCLSAMGGVVVLLAIVE
ncbi:hypothetical protein [Natrialba sp. PRR66]|uniref:hypothetical protein n=1 Tax=Natrialba sp. PRR66 TaxID=3098146 RepID=UPI002B1DEC2E|nr:hypothetical protein [Natrialba sp. PRR66]